MKKKIIISVIVILIIVAIGFGIWFFLKKPNETELVNEENTTLNNISGQYSDVKITDFQTAKESIEDVKEEIKIKSVSDELEETQNNSNETFNTYNFKQVYNGLEVIDGDLLVYADKEGNAKGIINKYKEISELNTTPKNTQESLKEVVKSEIKKTYENEVEIKDGKLVIYPIEDKYILAYKYELDLGLDDVNTIIYVSDETKEILNIVNPIYGVENYSEFLKDGIYILEDTSRNIKIQKALNPTIDEKTEFQEYTWSNSTDAENEENQLAIKAVKTIQQIYDYYKEKYNWLSVDGKGNVRITIITGANKVDSGDEIINDFETNAAFIKPNYIILGSKNIYNDNIEILGHEYNHGVFYYTVGKCEKNTLQTNALHEAYADIMGMCIETYYNKNENLDWYINSNLGRDIKNSNVKYTDLPQFGGKVGEWIYSMFNKEEHYYSLVISKAAYLMSDALTLKEFEELWYKSMSLLPDNPNFYDCVYAVLTTARAIGLTDSQIQKIADAFDKVGLTATDTLNTHIGKVESWAKDKFYNNAINNVIGDWKATKTSNDNYSLGYIYGTSVTTNNSLKLNKDGTYTLYLGFTFSQKGNYQISGTTINLTNNEYTGDSPDHKMAQQLKINDDQIILEEKADDNTSINIIFENVKNISNNTISTETNNNNNKTNNETTSTNKTNTNTSTNTNNNTSTTTQTPSQTTAKDFKVGSATVKYGTYKGIDAATGDTLILKSDGTALINGKSYTFAVEKYNFGQDSSSSSMEDGIVFKNSSGSTVFAVYVGNDGTLYNEPNGYVYSGN